MTWLFRGSNVVSKMGRRRAQPRDFSSVSEKDVPMGDLELFVNNVAGLCFKGVSGVVGFVLAGLTVPGVSENVKNDEKMIIHMKQNNDKRELNMEEMRIEQLERNRKHLSRKTRYAYQGNEDSSSI
ncbi:unnamed protein product [Eruca vesicaria subsp. sativa]|uniref:Uncharacterized protein n=1 Tax=Eruca vesicaria subsp. sativa TaxID=29727 RepID=A0ABC8LJR3_ERUVS|nr:unnamed protein product [Eruca vesicaria subsp. sativa]